MTRHSHQLCSTIQKHGFWANYIETTPHKMSVAGRVVQPFRLTLRHIEVSHSIKGGGEGGRGDTLIQRCVPLKGTH